MFQTLLLIAALVLFILAALPRITTSIDLVPAGLACLTGAIILGTGIL
jgi:hypothetical protein